MRICVVIQSDAFRSSAGMRIRYDRFRDSLASSDASIDTVTCADLAASKALDHDVYVFCKTFDMTALLLARRIRAAGKAVGHDFFDDYFSQRRDPRLRRYREWLRDMASVTDFAICSTPRMVEVVRAYMPDIRITAVDDPVVGFDADVVAALADQKIEQARSSRVLEVLWFGIGDNPFFPVGLVDLAACDSEFAAMERLGWTVRLRIVTNRRGFEGAEGQALRRLSIGFDLLEWTEEAEHEALKAATIAIIPVSGQPFSRAKSLNRALTALSAGCQVLSVGYPLYDRIGDFIYRSTGDLLRDLETQQSRLGATTVGDLAARIALLADPSNAASTFVDEARRARDGIASRVPPKGPLVVLHGRASTIGIHKTAGALGGFSVKTVFCNSAWNFPVRFDREGAELVMRVTPAIAQKFQLPLREGSQARKFGIYEFVDVDTMSMGVSTSRIPLCSTNNAVLDLPIYEAAMRFAEECCSAAFPGADILISDTSIFARRPIASSLPRRATRNPPQAHAPKPRNRTGGSSWLPFRRVGGLVKNHRSKSVAKGSDLLANSSLFDADWYLATYPDVAAGGTDPARHYLEFGWREGRNPSALFSTKDYLKANADVAEQGINPLVHYLEFGEVEGRKAPAVAKGATTP